MMPNVSVILTVFNTEKYLRKCIDSLLKQTLKNIEIICVDDASEDNSVAILKEYQKIDKRLRIIEFTTNKGANFARNTALKKAEGKYVVVLDADDFYETDFLEKLHNQAEKTNADIVFCGFNLFDNETQKIQEIDWDIERKILPEDEVFSHSPKLFDLLPSFVWNQLYRRKFIEKNNLQFANIRSYTDVYFNKTALLKAKRISYVDEKLVYYRVNNKESISHNLTYSGAVRTIYALADFLQKENLFVRYQKAFFATSTKKMQRTLRVPEPYCSLLFSFYQKHLIPKFWPQEIAQEFFSSVGFFDNCTDNFKHFFFNKREKILPIVLAADGKTLPLAAVTIQSITENANSEYFYDIYVMSKGIPEAMRFNLMLTEKENVRISFIDMSYKISEKIRYKKYYTHIPELFDGYEKILYLSNSALVQNDLSKLLETDIKYEFAVKLSDLSTEKILNLASRKKSATVALIFNLKLCQQKNLAKILNKNTFPLISDNNFHPLVDTDNLQMQKWWQTARNSVFYEVFIRSLV